MPEDISHKAVAASYESKRLVDDLTRYGTGTSKNKNKHVQKLRREALDSIQTAVNLNEKVKAGINKGAHYEPPANVAHYAKRADEYQHKAQVHVNDARRPQTLKEREMHMMSAKYDIGRSLAANQSVKNILGTGKSKSKKKK